MPAFCQAVALAVQNSATRYGTVRPSAIMSVGALDIRDVAPSGLPPKLLYERLVGMGLEPAPQPSSPCRIWPPALSLRDFWMMLWRTI
jgi:hypothetical protein